MMKSGKRFVVVFFTLLLYAGVFTGCVKHSDLTSAEACKKIHLDDSLYENGPEGDETKILSYRIENNCLYLTVAYGGGCKEHDIQLAARSLMYCKPPLMVAKVVHDDQDFCKAYIVEEIGFDLTPMGCNGDFNINIKGFDQQIQFKYIR